MCALSVVCNYNCVGNNGATAAVMDTLKLVQMQYNLYHVIFCSFTCVLDDQALVCTQKITLQYSDAICLEPCLSCKINLNRSRCDEGACCAVTNLLCDFEPEIPGCSGNSTGVCEANFTIITFENNITNLTIIYNGGTYDTSKEKEFLLVVLCYLTDVMGFPDFSVVNCSDFVASSSSSLMEPSHASSKLKEKIIF